MFRRFLARVVAMMVFGAAAQGAGAFCIPNTNDNSATVLEYFDAASGRFYPSWRSLAYLEGCYPPTLDYPPPEDATPTALSLRSWAFARSCTGYYSDSPLCGLSRQVCVYRADGQPDPPSHFLSINAQECAVLGRPGSGWTRVPTAAERFGASAPALAAFEVDPATGQCPGNLAAVYRFVNDRWAEGLGNLRYVADPAVRQQMRARPGWTEEGIAFCVLSAARYDLLRTQASFSTLGAFVMPVEPGCVNGAGRTDYLCIEGINMAPSFGTLRGTLDASGYGARTGAAAPSGTGAFVIAYPSSSDAAAASRSFAQTFASTNTAGFQVSSSDRLAEGPSAIRARRILFSPLQSEPVRPFAVNEVDMEFALAYRLFVKRVRSEGVGNEAYIQPLVTFIDARSAMAVVLSAGAIGTVDASDGTGRDAASGNALVFVNLGATTSIGRSLGLSSLRVPRTFDAENPWGWGGDFIYRLDRGDFLRILDRARTVEPRLSPEPGDYLLESFGLKGEVVGVSEIGYNLERLEISITRP